MLFVLTGRRFVARLIARTGVGIAMANVRFPCGARQANNHAVMMHGPETFGLFRRLGGTGSRGRATGYWQRAGRIVIRGKGAEG